MWLSWKRIFALTFGGWLNSERKRQDVSESGGWPVGDLFVHLYSEARPLLMQLRSPKRRSHRRLCKENAAANSWCPFVHRSWTRRQLTYPAGSRLGSIAPVHRRLSFWWSRPSGHREGERLLHTSFTPLNLVLTLEHSRHPFCLLRTATEASEAWFETEEEEKRQNYVCLI